MPPLYDKRRAGERGAQTFNNAAAHGTQLSQMATGFAPALTATVSLNTPPDLPDFGSNTLGQIGLGRDQSFRWRLTDLCPPDQIITNRASNYPPHNI